MKLQEVLALPPTTEQEAFYNALTDSDQNIALIAMAGSGKTTTLQVAAHRMKQVGILPDRTLALAFNKKNAADLVERMPDTVTCKTFHSLGLGALTRLVGARKTIDKGKVTRIVSTFTKEYGLGDEYNSIRTLVDKLRGQGYVPLYCKYIDRVTKSFKSTYESAEQEVEMIMQLGDTEFVEHNSEEVAVAVIRCLDRCWSEVWQTGGKIDFEDMTVSSVIFGAPFEKHALIFADEVQDFDSIQHTILARSLDYNGRLIAVGDPRQAIYGWRGAMLDSVDKLVKKFKMQTLPLSINWRCGSDIIKKAQSLVPELRPRPDAWLGKVYNIIDWETKDLPENITVICRNNAPLMKLGFQLVKAGRGFEYAGRDFSRDLLSVVKKVAGKSKPEVIKIAEFMHLLELWEQREIEKAELKKMTSYAEAVSDRASCVRIVADNIISEFGTDVTAGKFEEAIAQIFESSGSIYLSTIHRIKGMEMDHVIILNPHLIPNKWVVKEEDEEMIQQEWNLKYVAETRAKFLLGYMNFGENLLGLDQLQTVLGTETEPLPCKGWRDDGRPIDVSPEDWRLHWKENLDDYENDAYAHKINELFTGDNC